MSEKSFGSLIRAKRKEQGIRIEEMAKRCGISSRGYGNIELGYASPKLGNLLAIATVLSIDLGELNVLKTGTDEGRS